MSTSENHGGDSAVVPATAPAGGVMVFDGHTTQVTIGHPLPPLPAGATIEFWARGGDELPRATSVFAAWKADGARVFNVHLPWADGVVYWDAGSDGFDRIQIAAQPADYQGSWTHWAFVKDCARQEMAIYRNGLLWHHGGGLSRPITEESFVVIGAYTDGNYKWIGRLAELRIWDRPRSALDISADHDRRLTGQEPGLLGCWPLSEIDDLGVTPDLTGNRPGTVHCETIVRDDALSLAHPAVPTAPAPAEPEPATASGAAPAEAIPEPKPSNGDGAAAAAALTANAGEAGPTDSVLVKILQYNEGRKRRLVKLKLKRMAHDPFAFFRGSDHLFAEAWPDLKLAEPGPEIPICGDLHLENFGAYRTDDGELLFDINDFDEAVVAPCSLDVVRCATSVLLAAELWRLTPLQASGMVLAFLEHYGSNVIGTDARWALDSRTPRLAKGPIWEILGKSAQADQGELLDHYTEKSKNGTRRIIRSHNGHPAVGAGRTQEITAAVDEYGARLGRADFFKTIDVTWRVAGIGSLGLKRYTVLVAGGGSARTNRLFDLKECRPSALRSCTATPWPFPDETDAARVVHAQRVLQAWTTAGLDVLPLDETTYRVRELIPEENRSSLARFNKKPQKLRLAIEEAGLLTALAHRRGAEAAPDGNALQALSEWATGPALDSVLAAAARFAERTRLAYRQFRAELRAPASLPAALRKRYLR